MQCIPIKSTRIKKYDDITAILFNLFLKQKYRPKNGDIVAISSKVVAVSEGRMVKLSDVRVSQKARNLKKSHYGIGLEDPRLIQLVLNESEKIFPGMMLLSLKNNILIPAAGIDLSNAPEGYAILWPANPQKSAQRLCNLIKKKFRLQRFGVVITDSHCKPLRWGTVGLALAFAGFEGVEDIRGQKDLYGKKLRVTRKAVADNLASAALLLMGEANEQTPFVLIRNAPVKFTNRLMSSYEITMKPKKCIFSGIYSKKFLDMLK